MCGYTQAHFSNYCNFVPVYNDLATANPSLAAQWHPFKNGDLTPRQVTFGSNKKVWWGHLHSESGTWHEWEATINSRNSGKGCPICSGKKVLAGFNDLATTHPELAAQWHPTKNRDLTPHQITAGSDKKVIWMCEAGHDWPATISSRARTGCGCPYCAGKKALPGVNDLATTNPDLAAQWHPTKNGNLTPQNVTAGSNKKVWWQCEKGHEWEAKICNRASGRNCPICSGKKVLSGFNDLATVNPELAAQWHPTKNNELTPHDVTAMSSKSVYWLGSCDHEWEAKISNRSNGKGCPYCSSVKLLVGFNDLATTHPGIAAQWHPTKNGDLTPQDVMANSELFDVWWQCEHGHEWKIAIGVRTAGHNCPYCSGRNAICGVNDLATLRPDLASQWHPTKNAELAPQDVKAGSDKKVWWLGECGHEWEATILSRSNGSGCPYCSRAGTSRMQEALRHAFTDLFGEDCVSPRDYERMGFEIDILLRILTPNGTEIGIEVGSRYHHSNINKDLYKIRRCAEENIMLLGYIDGCREEERPAELPESWGWYPHDTFREKGQMALHGFFDMVCGLYGIENASSLVDWDKINAKVNAYFQHIDAEAA